MIAINLLPTSRRLKESIKQGWCRHAWNATTIVYLKPVSAVAAFCCLIGVGLRSPIVLFSIVFSTIIIILFVITLPWYLFKIYLNIINNKARYAVVIDCSPSEFPTVYQTIFDILDKTNQHCSYSPLQLSNNYLCHGTRSTALWMVKQLYDIGIPCRIKWIRDDSMLDEYMIFTYHYCDYGFSIDSDAPEWSLSDMLESVLLFYNAPEALDLITN